MKTPTVPSITTVMALIAMLLAYTQAFNVNPSTVNGHSLKPTSSTGLFHQSGILERPLKSPKTKNTKKKVTSVKYSIDEAKDLSVGSLILLLNDPQVRHKVRRRPRLIPVDQGKRHCKAMRAFQEGQELARLAVQEVLREYNIRDVSV